MPPGFGLEWCIAHRVSITCRACNPRRQSDGKHAAPKELMEATASKVGGAGARTPDSSRQKQGWRRSLVLYGDARVLLTLPLGFVSGLPLLLTFSTLSARLATAGVTRAAIGAFALVGTPYALKFVWSPIIDWLPPPLPLGRRRGWGVSIQIALIGATLALGRCNPANNLATIGALALLV